VTADYPPLEWRRPRSKRAQRPHSSHPRTPREREKSPTLSPSESRRGKKEPSAQRAPRAKKEPLAQARAQRAKKEPSAQASPASEKKSPFHKEWALGSASVRPVWSRTDSQGRMNSPLSPVSSTGKYHNDDKSQRIRRTNRIVAYSPQIRFLVCVGAPWREACRRSQIIECGLRRFRHDEYVLAHRTTGSAGNIEVPGVRSVPGGEANRNL
jgi:hypothetical protein